MDTLSTALDVLVNNEWKVINMPGNVMFLILIAFLGVNIATNKKLNLMQLSGNMLLFTLLFIFIFVRG